MRWKAKASTAATGVGALAEVPVAARTAGVGPAAVAGDEVGARMAVSALVQGHRPQRVPVTALVRPLGQDQAQGRLTVLVVAASRRIVSTVPVHATDHAATASLPKEWRRNYDLMRTRTQIGRAHV